jgi:hypothetical protein
VSPLEGQGQSESVPWPVVVGGAVPWLLAGGSWGGPSWGEAAAAAAAAAFAWWNLFVDGLKRVGSQAQVCLFGLLGLCVCCAGL